jgi:hypothetical protein
MFSIYIAQDRVKNIFAIFGLVPKPQPVLANKGKTSISNYYFGFSGFSMTKNSKKCLLKTNILINKCPFYM